MIKLTKLILVLFIFYGCAYEPVLLKKDYNFNFSNIASEGEEKVNEIIKDKLAESTENRSTNKYNIIFISEKYKDIISSNKKGDPTIYRIRINVKYNLIENNKIILKNEIFKQATYNNIDDKFELLKYEENILNNLSERFAEDILISISTVLK
tara:strand:+ start:218 stop:676 length:459 start_codon:yes stop_codon:yes gene_type:complete